MAKKKKGDTYYERNYKELDKLIQQYRENIYVNRLFGNSDLNILRNIETGITKHRLRYYQMDGLIVLDNILKVNEDNNIKKELLDIVDDETGKKAPFIGYEMATGSGKTMLMGASIYFLNKKYGIKNFLIITPASTDIYQKTIRNFTVGNFESVWADDTPFKFNIITGDNYTQNLFYDEKKDVNIFIFNISKFGANAVNTSSTWESAIWKDKEGNSISIKEFLKNEKLVIITDEAHHAQNIASNKIIKSFHPDMVLEFTATAVEKEKSENKKNQTIAYKYDIRNFLEDGHGKLVRAIAINTEEKSSKNEITNTEKQKLITLMLIHLLKKKSVLLDDKSKSIKPLAFIKVKNDTKFTQKVFDYITQEIFEDSENISIILEKIKDPDLEITTLLWEMYEKDYRKDINALKKDIKNSVQTSIFYHGKSDKETEKKFVEIRKNEIEIVVYMQRLDEGIDLPNIYSMAVINDTSNDFKTSVKQIIGRGVRLPKNEREFDNEENLLKANSEKLHIVCDQGKNFEEVIEAIQQEFGLNSKYLAFDKPKEKITNKAKSHILKGKYLPHIKAEYIVKEGIQLIDLIRNISSVTDSYLKDNCFESDDGTGDFFIKYRPNSFFMEIDVFSDKKVYHKQIQQSGGKKTQLLIQDSDINSIYSFACKNLYCMPDNSEIRGYFKSYIETLNNKGLMFYKIDEADEKLALNNFISSFSWFYRSYIEKHYYKLNFRELNEDDSWNLSQQFSDYDIKLPKDQIKNKARLKYKDDEKKLHELINGGYNFYGYEKSIYDYDKFDSYTEYQFAEYVNEVLKTIQEENKPFWVRNQRNIYFTYGSRKYYPDFIVFKDRYIYVVETKGEIYSDQKKNILLKKLDDVPGENGIEGYKGVLVFSSQMDKTSDGNIDWEKFIEEAEEIHKKINEEISYIDNPNEDDKFKKYLPVYDGERAYKKFIKKNKTAKCSGWLEVEERDYAESIYLLKVEDGNLYPKYKVGDFIYLDSNYDINQINNKLVLIHNKNIDEKWYGKKPKDKEEMNKQEDLEEVKNMYGSNISLNFIEIDVRKSVGELFGRNVLILKDLENKKNIELNDVKSAGDIEIMGIEIKEGNL